MAPLEFILAYPTFLALLACSIWVAGMFIRKSEMTITARHAADTKRVGPAPASGSEPFSFGAAGEGWSTSRTQTNFNFSGIMPTGNVSAAQTVMLGTWSFEQVPMNIVPDYELTIRLSGRGPGDALLGQLGDLLALIGDIGQAADSLSSLFGLDTDNFFSSFSDAVSQIQDFDGGESSSLKNSSDAVSGIAPVIDELLNLFGSARKESKQRVADGAEDLKKTRDSTAQAARQFEPAGGIASRSGQTADSETLKDDEKQTALANDAAQLQDVFARTKNSLETGTAKSAKDADTLFKGTFKQKIAPNIPDLPGLEGLAGDVQSNGIAALARRADKVMTDLATAVKDKDEDEIEDLKKSLDFIVRSTQDVLNESASTAANMSDKANSINN